MYKKIEQYQRSYIYRSINMQTNFICTPQSQYLQVMNLVAKFIKLSKYKNLSK